MRAIVYVRNSSGKQVAAGTHEGLLASGHETARTLGATVVAVYVDAGISAKSGNLAARGDFARLVADLPTLRPDLCIVANVDRLTRTELFRELGEIWGPLQEAGVKVATSSGVLDLNTPEGQLMAMFESWRSASENAARRRRSITGRARAAREGRNPGRAPFGYRHVGGTWTAPGGPIILEAHQRGADGEVLSDVARDFNERGIRSESGRPWSSSMVREIIQCRRGNGDPYVTGLWIGHRNEAAIPVPAIVPAELAARARAVVSARAHHPPTSTKHVNFLDERIAKCGLCGHWVGVVSCCGRRRLDGTRDRFAYYTCSERYGGKARGTSCTLPLRRVELVDNRLWAAATAWASGGAVGVATIAAEGREQVQCDLEEARAKLAAEDARLAALTEALGDGTISAEAYRAQAAKVKPRRDLLAQQVATWEAAAGKEAEASAAEVAAVKMAIRAASVEASAAQRRALVRSLWPRWVMGLDEVAVLSGGGVGEATAAPAKIAPMLRVAL